MRPTSDRVRESLFARLGPLEGAAVLDLYAGTGALGIEALSRGAASAVFVERARPALACLRANLGDLGLEPASRVLGLEVRAALALLGREGRRFDLVLADPPYGDAGAPLALRALAEHGLLAPRGTLVLETAWRHPPEDVPGLVSLDQRRVGDTLVARYAAAESPARGEGAEPE